MAEKILLNIPLNRIEGDLEVRAELEDGYITNAWSSGVMYRGFEQILVGRGSLDGLIITPRICGICGTSHLTAASQALDMIAGMTPPLNAIRIRNIALIAEYLQNDLRQTFLMFTADFTNPAYQDEHLFEEAVRRYEPFKGETVFEVIKHTKKILEIIAIIGGQWPHSSYMVPGGIVSVPSTSDLLQCRFLLKEYRRWYEHRVLGCSLERWFSVNSAADLDEWLEENETHWTSDLGFFIRFARKIGLDKIGRGHGNYLSYGALPLPEDTHVRNPNAPPGLPGDHEQHLVPAGFAQGIQIEPFDQQKVVEHVAYSWFVDYEGGKHPFEGETHPYASGQESEKYSWAKAPRYNDFPAETGPLAEMMIAGNPLFIDLVNHHGPSAFTRQLARIVRAAQLIPVMDTWLLEATQEGKFYISPGELTQGEGFGLTEGARGALGHWVRIVDRQIEHYQIITPTAWNASPRDSNGVRGPWEEALIGTKIKNYSDPVELGHIVRSFDACLFCTVHVITHGRRLSLITVGDMR